MHSTARVLLINPSMGRYYANIRVRGAISINPPLNLAMLAGALMARGNHVKILDLEAESGLERNLGNLLQTFSPDVIGISVRTPLAREATRLANRIRRLSPQSRLIAGGVHPSVLPDNVLNDGFDIAVINEGEETLCEIAAARPLNSIAGIAYKDTDTIVRTPPRPRVGNLDQLPYPAWQLYDLSSYHKRSLVAAHPPVADLESSRGCPSNCIYCTRSVLGKTFRAKSPERFVDEVEQCRHHGFKSFNLVDDCFTTDIERAASICETLRHRDLGMPWTLTNGIRVSHCDRAFFRSAARSGLQLVAFGLETGDQALLDRIGKGTTQAEARRAVSLAHSFGITTLGYFMVGLPGETRASLNATLDLARELELDYAKFSITVPLPGTELYEMWKPRINPQHFDELNIHRANQRLFSHPNLTWQEIEQFVQQAYRAFYFRPSYLLERIRRDIHQGNFIFNVRTALEMRW